MKSSKALVKIQSEEPESYEREISATFENGGRIYFSARGTSVGKCLKQVLAAVTAIELEAELVLSFKLRYWALDENLDSIVLEVESSDSQVEGQRPEPLQRIARRMAAHVKVKFLRMMANQGIALYGSNGSLEKGGAK